MTRVFGCDLQVERFARWRHMRKNLVDMNIAVEQAAVLDSRIVERNPNRERRVGVIWTEIEIILVNRLGAAQLGRLHEHLAEEHGNAGADQLMDHRNQIRDGWPCREKPSR